MEYVVKFNHTRENWENDRFGKAVVERLFVKTRERAIEGLNKMYEIWNKEFAKPWEIFDQKDYDAYIEQKTNEFLTANGLNCLPERGASFVMRIYSKNGDIYGYSELYNDEVYATLEPR